MESEKNLEIWKFGNLEIWKFENVEMGGWEGEKVR
jgi:hypothetical protein